MYARSVSFFKIFCLIYTCEWVTDVQHVHTEEGSMFNTLMTEQVWAVVPESLLQGTRAACSVSCQSPTLCAAALLPQVLNKWTEIAAYRSFNVYPDFLNSFSSAFLNSMKGCLRLCLGKHDQVFLWS